MLKIAKIGSLFLLSVLAILYLFFNDPNSGAFYFTCPFKAITGYVCPGCGSQRAMHQLLQGNLVAAFQEHPLLILLLPYLMAGIIVQYTAAYWAFAERWKNHLFNAKVASALVILILGFWWYRVFVECKDCLL